MPKMLIDGAIEYEDGTPATESQVGFSSTDVIPNFFIEFLSFKLNT